MSSSSITPPPASSAAAAAPSTSNAAPQEIKNDPARTGFSPEMSWWMNYFKQLSGQMTPEGQFHFREWRYRVHEERDCKRCEDDLKWVFTYSPVVRFMSEKIQALNGRIDASNVYCRRCESHLEPNGQVLRQSGGFSPDHGILICANEVRDRKHLEDTLAHEMVHAWDTLRWKNVDFMGKKDLKHAACTEVGPISMSQETTILTHLKDPSFNAQWRVQVDSRSFHPRKLEVDTTIPKLRPRASHSVRHGSKYVQGRRTSSQSRQPSLGFLLLRYTALRRGL